MTNAKLNQGQSLFEVVLALGIMSIITVGVVILTVYTVRNATFSKNKNLASKYAQEAVEWLRSEKDKDQPTFITNAIGNYCLSTLSWSNTGVCSSGEMISNTYFTRNVIFEQATLSGKNVITATVTVSWEDSQGTHESQTITNFTDLREQ